MRSLLMIWAASVMLAFPTVSRADCLKEVEALEQRLSPKPTTDSPDKTGADTGITVAVRPSIPRAAPRNPPRAGSAVRRNKDSRWRRGSQRRDASAKRATKPLAAENSKRRKASAARNSALGGGRLAGLRKERHDGPAPRFDC